MRVFSHVFTEAQVQHISPIDVSKEFRAETVFVAHVCSIARIQSKIVPFQ